MKTISKILSIVLCLAMVMALFVVGASADTTKDVVAAGTNTADFSALKKDGTNDNSYAARESKDGWKATNAALSVDWPAGISAVVLNGKKTACGTLTSGTLTGPLKTISFKYGFPFSDTQFKLTINVKQNGQVVASKVLEKTGLSKTTEYAFTWDLDTAVTGDFTLEFVNNAKSQNSGNKDRLAIWGLSWSGTSGAVHTHDGEATSTKCDAKQHWTVYACGEIKGEKANHTFTNGVCSCGVLETATPVAGTTYKAGTFQATLGKTIYVTGAIKNDRFLATTETRADGVDVTVEAATGGFYLSFMAGTTKKYIDLKVTDSAQGYVNVVIADAPGVVYTFDATHKTFVATLTTAKYGEDIYFIGANGTYDTLGSSHDGNLGSYFPLYLYAIETTGGSGNEGTGNEGTGNEGTGNEGTGNEGGNTQTPVAPKPFVPSTGVDTPVAGTAFKLGLYQKNVEKYLYFNNTTPSADRPYYQGTTDKFAEAVDVFAEAVEGGYKLYFMDGTTKTYIDIYQNGTYVNLRLTTEPTAVFTWNTEHKTFVTKIGEDEYYIGTYDKFETISACKLSKIADSFASHLYAKEPAKTGDNSVISVAVAAAVLSIMGAAVLVSKKKEF